MLLDRFVDADVPSPEPVGVRTPTPADVERLRSVVGTCLVTVTVATEPSPLGMDTAEAFRLAAALAEVERRLRLELPLDEAVRLADRCRRLAVDVIEEPTGHGLMVLVGAGVAEAHRLAVAPIERVVIDPTFATRDLERSVQEQPPALVAVVDGVGVVVAVVDDRGVHPTSDRPPTPPPAHPAAQHRWAREVAAAVERELAERRLPLVVVGPRSLRELIGGHLDTVPVASLEARVAPTRVELVPMVRTALASAHRRALAAGLARVEDAANTGAVLRGMDAVWSAACSGGLDLVVVDAAYAPSARIDRGGGIVELVEDPSPPGVTDDLVDELVELTVLTGGRVLFAEPGGLGPDGVAAVPRPATGPAPLDRLVGVA